MVDELIELAGLDRERPVLEIGAGTGKATAAFAARGIPVLALEPSEAMARIARRNCAEYPGVRIEVTDFERLRPADERYPLIYAGQSWHWIAPEVRYARAREALAGGGVLAAFWNRPLWSRVEQRPGWPRLTPGSRRAPRSIDGPMHPDNPDVHEQREEWDDEAALASGLDETQVRTYQWALYYSAAEYVDLLGTLSDHRLLAERTRQALLEAVAHVIESGGGRLRMAHVTRLRLAYAV
jgi:SAM-dependent methyltransferase